MHLYGIHVILSFCIKVYQSDKKKIITTFFLPIIYLYLFTPQEEAHYTFQIVQPPYLYQSLQIAIFHQHPY